MFSRHLEEPSLGSLLVPQVKLTAVHIIRAVEQVSIPLILDLIFLEKQISPCSGLSITVFAITSPYWKNKNIIINNNTLTRNTYLAITFDKLGLVTAFKLSPVGRG